MICRVSLPYADEERAIREIGRILDGGGTLRACHHGLGYYVRYLVLGPGKRRFYGVRAIVNTWLYRLVGRRLPGWLGDTIYQSRRRLARLYADSSLRVVEEPRSPRYLGFPVFVYQIVEKI